jgi:hypothetical protein
MSFDNADYISYHDNPAWQVIPLSDRAAAKPSPVRPPTLSQLQIRV